MLDALPLTGSLSQGNLHDNYQGTGGSSGIKDIKELLN